MKKLLIRIALLAFVCSMGVAQAKKPNVVFVITDDQGYGDLSCHGNPILKTPNLDALHAESVRLTDYHVSPTCAPSRGALLSGHFTNRAGPWHTIMGRSMLFEGEHTFGSVFGMNGYATGMFGKWHLGDNYPFRPQDRGFQETVNHGGGGVGQTPDNWDNAYFDDTLNHNGVPTKYKGYCTDVYFQEAQRFIEESVAKDKPFIAYICSNAPHSPFHAPEKYWKKYLKPLKNNDRLAIFYGMIENIDENVGKMRTFLKEKGLDQNTIFVFTTDNGTASGAKIHNNGMRGQKGSEYDGGHRVPFFIHWPGGGLAKPRDVETLTAHIDILPTLIDLCDLKPVENYTFDGVSIASLIKGEKVQWPDRTIITDSQRVKDPIMWRKSATMTERWRLINGKELYDIDADPGQTKNVANEFPEIVKRLRADYEAWWADISPVFKKDARIIVGNPAENPARLTCHDWLTLSGGTPWHQSHIRGQAKGTGEWALKVEKAGTYKVSLRRWPRVVDAAITASIPAGAPVPGLKAFRETPGKALGAKTAGLRVGDFQKELPVGAKDQEITFEVELKKGPVYLEGYFLLDDGKKLGSYYAYVEKI